MQHAMEQAASMRFKAAPTSAITSTHSRLHTGLAAPGTGSLRLLALCGIGLCNAAQVLRKPALLLWALCGIGLCNAAQVLRKPALLPSSSEFGSPKLLMILGMGTPELIPNPMVPVSCSGVPWKGHLWDIGTYGTRGPYETWLVL